MKGDANIIKHLNILLKNELTAINQYLLNAHLLDDWGITKLGKHEHQESAEERVHANQLISRILFLEGEPDLNSAGNAIACKNVEEILQIDLKLELQGISDLKAAIAAAEAAGDYVSKDLFIAILKDEEGHVDHLETTMTNIKLQGLQNFIQSQTGDAE